MALARTESTQAPNRPLQITLVLAGTAALLAALSMAVIFGAVISRIATNAYGATGDFLSFYAAGYIVRSGLGEKLYDPEMLESAQRYLYPGGFEHPIGYPLPVFVAWVFAAFSLLPFTASFFLWMAVCVALLVAVLFVLARELRDVPSLPRRAFLLLAATSMPAITTVVFGQVDSIVLAGLLGGYLGLRSNRPDIAGLALCAVLVKPHFLAGVGLLLLLRGEWRTVRTLTLIGVPLLIVPALLTSPNTVLGIFTLVASYPGADDNLSVNAEMMANWRGFVVSATNSNSVLYWLPGQALIAIGALAIAVPRWRASGGGPSFDRAYSLAVLLPLLISPHLHTQSLALLLVPAALWLRGALDATASEARQQAYLAAMLAAYAALFFLPFFAIQGLSLTVFLVLCAYMATAYRWPGCAATEAIDREAEPLARAA
jgi:hypothetical protein